MTHLLWNSAGPRLSRALALIVSSLAAGLALASCAVGPDVAPEDVAAGADQVCGGWRASIEYAEKIDSSGGSLVLTCLPTRLYPDGRGQVPCFVVEGKSVGAAEAESCNACAAPGRQEVLDLERGLVDRMKAENPSAALDCFCNIEQYDTQDPDWNHPPCQHDKATAPLDGQGHPVNGFCYLSDEQGIGDPEILDSCPREEKRGLRFVGAGVPEADAVVYVVCVSESYGPAVSECPD